MYSKETYEDAIEAIKREIDILNNIETRNELVNDRISALSWLLKIIDK